MTENIENSEIPEPKILSEAAKRALKEAEERRNALKAEALPKEIGGSKFSEPTRFGDWEKKGIAYDF